MSEQAYAQPIQVAGVSPTLAEDLRYAVKREDATTTVEPGVVADIDIANMFYYITAQD